jgi:DNA-directed RNA polymerase specialized sigma24 family protein
MGNMATKYTKVEALELVSGAIDSWAPALNPMLVDDLRQEMALAILESKQASATLSYYRNAMRNRAIDYLRRENRLRDREQTVLGALYERSHGIDRAARH